MQSHPVFNQKRSQPFRDLLILLGEVDLILEALPKRSRGRPKEESRDHVNAKRDAICKAAIVLLSAALEAYCEGLCRECNAHLKSHIGSLDNEDYGHINQSIRRSHGAGNDKIIALFGLVGIPWITYDAIGWQKKSSQEVRKELRELARARNKIAHGANQAAPDRKVRYWREFITRFADRMEAVTGERLAIRTGSPPPWG